MLKNNKNKIWDVIVIGGGASGMMTGAVASSLGKSVLLIQKNKNLGEKLKITGGGRCNITNNEPDIHKMTTRAFLETAKEHAVRYFQIKDLQGPQKKSDEEIKALAQTHEGLRGIQSEEDDFTLSVFPKDSVIWDPQLLRESLDIAYSSVVHEDLVFAISIPAGHQTEKGPIQEEIVTEALKETLLNLGLSEEDLARIMETRVQQRIDEKALADMIERGQVSLLEGAKRTERTWAITVSPLKKSPRN